MQFKISPQIILVCLVVGGRTWFPFLQNSSAATCCHLLYVTEDKFSCW